MVEQAQLINTTNASLKRHKTVRTVLTGTRSANHEGFERRKRSKKVLYSWKKRQMILFIVAVIVVIHWGVRSHRNMPIEWHTGEKVFISMKKCHLNLKCSNKNTLKIYTMKDKINQIKRKQSKAKQSKQKYFRKPPLGLGILSLYIRWQVKRHNFSLKKH